MLHAMRTMHFTNPVYAASTQGDRNRSVYLKLLEHRITFWICFTYGQECEDLIYR
jgi:hypothetical protein